MEETNKEILEWNNLKCPECGVNCDYFALEETRIFFGHKDNKSCKWVWEIKDGMLTESDLSEGIREDEDVYVEDEDEEEIN